MINIIKSILPDKLLIKIMYRYRMGKRVNLKNPLKYSEKLQWLKLNYHDPLYTKLVDKYEVKEWVANKIGSEYVIPNYGVWNSFEEIDFKNLPEKYVLKCTHDSGGLVICDGKKPLNYELARKKIKKSLKTNYYLLGREWPYKGVKPRIIAEKYMEDFCTKELRDYKFFVFNGVVKFMFVASSRQSEKEETKFDFFDKDFNHLDIKQGHPNSEKLPTKPLNYDTMISLAEKLGENMPHVRVDFYEVDGHVFFGEMTFYHMCGWTPIEPAKWDDLFGEYLKLPEKKL